MQQEMERVDQKFKQFKEVFELASEKLVEKTHKQLQMKFAAWEATFETKMRDFANSLRRGPLTETKEKNYVDNLNVDIKNRLH